MDIIKLKDLDIDIYHEKLDNGLNVYLCPRDDIRTNDVNFITKYGSIYNEFVPYSENKMHKFPKGIAHFLEHKVFEEKDDPQPMEFFAKSGTVCNAYTTFKMTSYLFYGTNNLKENVTYLLDYVQNLYLTDESVENEKSIIGEEIHMYDDSPGDVLAERVRHNAFNTSPFRDSITGTVEDIKNITKEDLEACYQTFYHPSNMYLVISGNFDPEEIISLVKENQASKVFKPCKDIRVKEIKEKDTVYRKEEIIKGNNLIPRVVYTIKIPTRDIGYSRSIVSLYLYILFTSLFNDTSDFDEELKRDGIINRTSSLSYLHADTHILISISNKTYKYKEFLDGVKRRLLDLSIDEKVFDRKKKVLISDSVSAYDSVEQVTKEIIDSIVCDEEIDDDPIGTIKSLNYGDFNRLISMIDISNTTSCVIKK